MYITLYTILLPFIKFVSLFIYLFVHNLKHIVIVYFAEQDYERAIDLYNKAIEANPNNAIYYSNRSISHLRTESFGYVSNKKTS